MSCTRPYFKKGSVMLSKIKKYRHGFVILSYFIVYLILFNYLEQRPVHSYHIVHTVFDDMIPFCEIFIIPYLLWFPYVILTVAYFLFIQQLRPAVFPRNNIFTQLVAGIYKTDTPTNILPSIHVFNSLAVYFAIRHCQALKNKKWIQIGSLILSTLIVLSTMFIKQHSVIDVCLGTTLALFGHLLFYPQRVEEYDEQRALSHIHKKNRKQNLEQNL